MANGVIQRSAEIPNFITDNTSTTTPVTTKDYTVSGNGWLIASASIISDNTAGTGGVEASISLNGTTVSYSQSRLTQSSAVWIGGNCCVGLAVKSGDVIRVKLVCEKTGNKTLYRNFLCFGCTVS